MTTAYRTNSIAKGRAIRPFAELAVVRATRDLCENEVRVPKGARGAIVLAYDGVDAYEVEFTEPVHAVIGVRGGDIELA